MINEKDDKIAKMEAEVKKLKDAKDDAYEKMMKEKEKYGSSDKWFHTDIVSYRKLHDAHADANDVWDKAYFKLKKMKEQAAKKKKSEGLDEETKLPTGVERVKARAEKAKEEIKAQTERIKKLQDTMKGAAPDFVAHKKKSIQNAKNIIKNLKAFLADVPDMLKKAQANEGVIMKPAKQLMSVLESLDANGELEELPMGDEPVEAEVTDLTDCDCGNGDDEYEMEFQDDDQDDEGEEELDEKELPMTKNKKTLQNALKHAQENLGKAKLRYSKSKDAEDKESVEFWQDRIKAIQSKMHEESEAEDGLEDDEKEDMTEEEMDSEEADAEKEIKEEEEGKEEEEIAEASSPEQRNAKDAIKKLTEVIRDLIKDNGTDKRHIDKERKEMKGEKDPKARARSKKLVDGLLKARASRIKQMKSLRAKKAGMIAKFKKSYGKK